MRVPSLDQAQMPDLQAPKWQLILRSLENGLLVIALALTTLLPFLEVALRQFFHTGIPAQGAFLQHLTLIIGMLGGTVAAREGKLLSLSALTTVMPTKMRLIANSWAGSISAVIAGLLCAGSVDFVQTDRASGNLIATNFPAWWLQMSMPLGFGIIALRLAWRAGNDWRSRVASAVLIALLVGCALHPPTEVQRMVPWAIAGLLSATVLGAPVFVTLGGAAVILFWGEAIPIAVVPLSHYSLVTNPSLPTIPLFTLAGYFLAEGGASQRLVRVFQAWFGSFRGGPAIITALVCAFFTSFTGGSGVTILALGGLLLPVLRASRYSERDAIGLLTSAGSLGMLFPPCLPVILYSIVASSNAGGGTSVSMEQMFLGGLGPGVLLVVLTALWGIKVQPRMAENERPRFDAREAWSALRNAVWEMLMPVVALGALFGGFATPVEAAAITALYAFTLEVVFKRNRAALRDAPRVMTECGILVGGVLLLFGVALAFTNYLVDAEIPTRLVDLATSNIHSKWVFLLVLNIVLLFVGGLVEIYASIVVVVPLLVPLGVAYGIDPVHLGIIFLANMELSFLVPPIPLNVLLASHRFKKPMSEIMRAVLPMLLVLFIGVLLITYLPSLTTWLPSICSHRGL